MRILIVEDARKLADLLRRVLSEERYTVDVAYEGDTGMEMALSGVHDLLILDVMLPGKDGFEILKAARAHRITAPILMLTARGEIEDRVKGLTTGADDYLIKPFAMEELLARITALLRRRDRELDVAQQLHVGDLTLDLTRHEARRADRLIELTPKEFSLLEYLMRNAGQALTRTQIINHVWSYDADAFSNVVDIYIHYLRDKIDRGFDRELIKTVRGVGYRLEKPDKA